MAVAAVIGRSFTFDILTAVCEQGELQAVHSLDELWQRHMVVEQGIDAYDFTHDRIREVAYLQISPARRRLLHRRVAANLEKLAGGAPADALCMQLAHHCEQGGNTERAIFWLQQAANAARAVFAHQDAVNLLEHALPLLKQLPGSSHRLEIELELQLTLCNTLDALSSHLGDQIEAAYLRALALCRQVTHTPHLFRVLWGLHEIALYRGAYHDSLRLALECLQIAEAADDAAMMVQAHHAAWGPYFYTGRYDEMQVHIIGALAVYCQELHEATSTYYGVHDAASCGLTLFSLALWNMGRLDQSADWLDRGIAHARSLAIPANVADALGYCALICQLLRDPQRAQEFAEPALHIFTQQAMHNASYLSAITLGWSLARAGCRGSVLSPPRDQFMSPVASPAAPQPAYLHVWRSLPGSRPCRRSAGGAGRGDRFLPPFSRSSLCTGPLFAQSARPAGAGWRRREGGSRLRGCAGAGA